LQALFSIIPHKDFLYGLLNTTHTQTRTPLRTTILNTATGELFIEKRATGLQPIFTWMESYGL
jgi:hypothetical protein